uniref:Uncharacterized protein n=1 Tax=Cannabis sativa TaxID=3483 RepID=A0A803Q7E3_CANSA
MYKSHYFAGGRPNGGLKSDANGIELSPSLKCVRRGCSIPVGFMVERNSSMVIQLAYDLEVLRAEHANVELSREEATNALAEANAKMEATIKQRASNSLDKALTRERKATKMERDRRDKYKYLHSTTLTKIKDLEVDLKHKEDLLPKILALEEANKAKEATQRTKTVDPGTTIPAGENMDDFALPTSDVPISTNSVIPKVSFDFQTQDS